MKHLVSIRDLSRQDALSLLSSAQELSQVNERSIKKLPTLRGRTVVNLFYENSTRTRISFEIAAKRLSADVINVSADSSSVTKGESLKDTAQTLEALGADCIVLRHPTSGAAHQLANFGWINSSVINAGDGTHEHPTQALLDALTIQQKLGEDLSEMKVLIVGDIRHSRVARSNAILLGMLGARVEFAGPDSLVPIELKNLAASISNDFDVSIANKPDVVMMLRVQRERMLENFKDSQREYINQWSLSRERLQKLAKRTLIMHPGPINRGLEISPEAAEDPRSVILQQVKNGLAVRMAVLHRLLSEEQ
ncbi:MAG: aspartate carbamoyltransferase catalytic subunit [Actinobacteria bacterium]|uniref:aspartate carbamoyltransferase n=1 Tax=freshwater metagenome TaxID=449393 RepID=A0A6J6DR97_9ZZZZ|nr:aspartate carbamoyltransferase catalytic subunit [Actinomycetota bacterium]MTA89425.1 aspartate carbamoyltransferase catalytic subunit [Actinomycetota bacterium]